MAMLLARGIFLAEAINGGPARQGDGDCGDGNQEVQLPRVRQARVPGVQPSRLAVGERGPERHGSERADRTHSMNQISLPSRLASSWLRSAAAARRLSRSASAATFAASNGRAIMP
ncbi:hypothetical protein [Mangrovicoccus ximenensis]|uniref:hypothetical protein n=1 Tax=Mangrovicoccus ximenensis TaxID=1911570 RepID=UPI0011AE64E4|nr:hypothetical protein [Mangrovicoccus ximenensis]